MKINAEYIVRLSETEATALRAILGNRSRNSDKDNGLTDKESDFLSALYDKLPMRDDHENQG